MSDMCESSLRDQGRSYPHPSVLERDVARYVAIAQRTSHRLRRKFPWIPADDLYSYALFGVVRSAQLYQSDRQVPFAAFAARKSAYVAIDEMRRDGIVRRADRPGRPTFRSLDPELLGACPQWRRLCDRRATRTTERMEAREWCAAMLNNLSARDRRMLMLRYSDGMTFREIGKVLRLSESAVCIRHNSLIRRLRRKARAQHLAVRGGPEGP